MCRPPDNAESHNLPVVCRNMCRLAADPREAEELVEAACEQRNITPNSSTHFAMANLYHMHEQLD